MNSLLGKIALVTGGTSGIGEASAELFAQAGAVVIVAGRDSSRGNNIVDRIRKQGGKAVFVELDITKESSMNEVVSFLEREFGRLDILFNNAGIYPVSPALENLTFDDGTEIFDINIKGTVMMINKCLTMLKQSKGVILNNASVAGLQGYTAGQSYYYSGSKAAIIKITQLIAKKYGSEIRANAICPGVVRTPIYKRFDEEKYRNNVPMGRVGEAMDIALVANFLVSDDARFVNGAIVAVDGGQSL